MLSNPTVNLYINQQLIQADHVRYSFSNKLITLEVTIQYFLYRLILDLFKDGKAYCLWEVLYPNDSKIVRDGYFTLTKISNDQEKKLVTLKLQALSDIKTIVI